MKLESMLESTVGWQLCGMGVYESSSRFGMGGGYTRWLNNGALTLEVAGG